MSSGSGLPPKEHAAFAVSSRLVSCIVTEQLLTAIFLPIQDVPDVAGSMVILNHSRQVKLDSFSIRPDEVFALVPLHHPPVVEKPPRIECDAYRVTLVDPLDMVPTVFRFANHGGGETVLSRSILERLPILLSRSTEKAHLRVVEDPLDLWTKFTQIYSLDDASRSSIAAELQSSLRWQVLSYQSPPACPSLRSQAIEWEQSLSAGHPTHPMHRARSIFSIDSNYDWYHPKLRIARVLKKDLKVYGEFEHYIAQITAAAGLTLPSTPEFVYVPVHELQVTNVMSRFSDVEILREDISIDAQAQSSIRTVIVPQAPSLSLKLAVGVKISSALRTISHFTADFGPRFSKEIVPRLAVNPKILAIERESASVVYQHDDPDVMKHFTVVIREQYEPAEGEAVIVTAALLEMDLAGIAPGVSVVEHVFELDSEAKREAFLDRYIKLACEALLPALVENGVAFEAHAQNILGRYDKETGQLLGFIFRDLGGLRIHPETLTASTGVKFDFLPGHCVTTDTLEEVYPKFYHTFVHNHIQRLCRVLGLHYNGKGWAMLRTHMASVIPPGHALRALWLDEGSRLVESKCLLRMRMQNSYRDMVYNHYPNMIQYRGSQIPPAAAETNVKEPSTETIFGAAVSRIQAVIQSVQHRLLSYFIA